MAIGRDQVVCTIRRVNERPSPTVQQSSVFDGRHIGFGLDELFQGLGKPSALLSIFRNRLVNGFKRESSPALLGPEPQRLSTVKPCDVEGQARNDETSGKRDCNAESAIPSAFCPCVRRSIGFGRFG